VHRHSLEETTVTFDLDERARITGPVTGPVSGPVTGPGQAPTDERFPEDIRNLVPPSIGVSLARIEDGRPYTTLASDEQVAALDAVQYIDGGPCVAAAERGTVQSLSTDRAAHGPWRTFGLAAAAVGVVETRSVPLDVDGRTVGTLNLYATAPDELADWDVLHDLGTTGISDPLAVHEASFGGRLDVALDPERIRDQNEVDWAVGLLSGLLGVDAAVAGDRLRTAAMRAGLDESSTARAVNRLLAR
jgi:hypothetical protein